MTNIRQVNTGRSAHPHYDDTIKVIGDLTARIEKLETQMTEMTPQLRRAASFTNVIGPGFVLPSERMTEYVKKSYSCACGDGCPAGTPC